MAERELHTTVDNRCSSRGPHLEYRCEFKVGHDGQHGYRPTLHEGYVFWPMTSSEVIADLEARLAAAEKEIHGLEVELANIINEPDSYAVVDAAKHIWRKAQERDDFKILLAEANEAADLRIDELENERDDAYQMGEQAGYDIGFDAGRDSANAELRQERDAAVGKAALADEMAALMKDTRTLDSGTITTYEQEEWGRHRFDVLARYDALTPAQQGEQDA